MDIYVGMALTQAPVEFREVFQAELREQLLAIEGVALLDFLGLEKGSVEDVYNHDAKYVVQADLCLFILDHPSIGLGIEMAMRTMSGRPYFCFARTSTRISRMVTGMLSVCKQSAVYRYDTASDIADLVQAW